ncbi:hypothetical protein TraAM80_00704 [Trypanosoma rangeli]|uniref:Uncharacterized protein n=1 Tax=Trypanosoma rangeli TaxID=5698 RepID=A0A3R7NUC0_TRYRA|nr:uncharacterized protein TraAM80_00704 [Trypanosoma rangeli]RNF11868.1 hypothetical protein TraAM80_00704 [Trypanosoma rangeli]|eukprot:RNF11868.1 hypothetical protein TraAM80_00704 [Trypanosoma rangeli]
MPVVLQCVVFLLLLYCQSSGLVSGDERATLTALRRLRAAVAQHDVEEVNRVIRDHSLERQLAFRAPSPLYWVANEKTESENLVRITQILLDYFGDSNYDYDRYHPLTRAARHHLAGVMATLLKWPSTIKEVHAKYLWCEDLTSLPESVRVVITPESPKCFRDFARVADYEHSELAKAARQHRQGAEDTVVEEFDWSNPFLSPPPGKKPTLKHFVMNPRAFVDFVEAILYYLWGEWELFYSIIYSVIIVAFNCATCAVFVAAWWRQR